MSEYNETAEETVTQDTETTASAGPVVISATNPDAEEMAGIVSNIKVNYDFSVTVRPVAFNFKKSKDKDTGIETMRETVQLAVPYPSVEGIVAILEAGGKGLDLLLESMENVVNAAARAELYDDTKLNAANFPVDKISWEAIANQPKAQRKGGGIPKETWEAFAQDYLEVMPAATGKTVDQVTNAAKILQNKFTQVKTNTPVLEMLVEQLAVYADSSDNAAEYAECIEFLLGKADTLLNVSDEDLLANL